MRVNEGPRQIGDVLVEFDAQLRRTAVVKETIRMKTPYGTPYVIPEGTKAFATNFTLLSGSKQERQQIDPIEWCMVLPKEVKGRPDGLTTICALWEAEDRARYIEDFPFGGFAFMPTLPNAGMPGVVPKIEEGSVDFGMKFMRQVRVSDITEEAVTLESVYTDGTHVRPDDKRSYRWNRIGEFDYKIGPATIFLKRAGDGKSMEVSLTSDEG